MKKLLIKPKDGIDEKTVWNFLLKNNCNIVFNEKGTISRVSNLLLKKLDILATYELYLEK